MRMAFLEAQIPQLKGATNYKKTSFKLDEKKIHPKYQMEMHKKTKEMISSTLTSTTMSLSKLQVNFSNA